MYHRSESGDSWKDPLTGLEWQVESLGEMSWYAAMEWVVSTVRKSQDKWRLPTIRELETLLDRSRYRPVMRQEVPFRDSLSYWSSTTFGIDTQNAWIIMFDGAYVLSYYKTNLYHVRLVQGNLAPGEADLPGGRQ